MLSGCHILFLDNADREHWEQIEEHLEGTSVLTISDDSG